MKGFYGCLSIMVAVLLACNSVMAVANNDPSKWSIISNAIISLNNYCESWRINVELNNLRKFDVVPSECAHYIGKYMTSIQYRVDLERAAEQALLYLTSLTLAGDGRDAWIFDIDDTLLSLLPYFKNHSFGGEKTNRTLVEKWMREMKAPALTELLPLYNQLKERGVEIFIITARREQLRNVTAQNLVKAGFTGWTDLIMKGESYNGKTSVRYKSEKREELVKKGYRILGNVGDQWSDLLGSAEGYRSFKLPNPMYYSE